MKSSLYRLPLEVHLNTGSYVVGGQAKNRR